jgi:alpha-amylase
MFLCVAMSVSIWVRKDAAGRERFGKFNTDIYKRE